MSINPKEKNLPADRAIEQIIASGAIRLAVGGTSLYIKALCEGLFEGPACDPEFRDALQTRAHREGLSSLHDELGRFDPEAAARIHLAGPQRVRGTDTKSPDYGSCTGKL